MSRVYFELNVALKRVSKVILALYQSQLRSDHYYETLPEVVVVDDVAEVVMVVVVDDDIVHGSCCSCSHRHFVSS